MVTCIRTQLSVEGMGELYKDIESTMLVYVLYFTPLIGAIFTLGPILIVYLHGINGFCVCMCISAFYSLTFRNNPHITVRSMLRGMVFGPSLSLCQGVGASVNTENLYLP